MSDASSDLGGIRAGPVERDIEQVLPANPVPACTPPGREDQFPLFFCFCFYRGATEMGCGWAVDTALTCFAPCVPPNSGLPPALCATRGNGA